MKGHGQTFHAVVGKEPDQVLLTTDYDKALAYRLKLGDDWRYWTVDHDKDYLEKKHGRKFK